MAVALVVAAGRGERLGSARPKALVSLAGKPMLEWSVDALRAAEGVERIVVALPPDALDAAPGGTVAVAGGAVRSESVREALAAAGEGSPVIVHDAARPLATAELFERAVAALEDTGADCVVAAMPVSDTLKEANGAGGAVTRTLDRSNLWAVQTPQVFRRDALAAALEQASEDLLARATDDAWLIEQRGGAVRIVRGAPDNIKVTTPVDLELAGLLLARRVG